MICISNAVLFGISTLKQPVLSTIPYISLPAVHAAELFALHSALQTILYLDALFLFPVKNAKEFISVLLLTVHALNHLWDNILPFSML